MARKINPINVILIKNRLISEPYVLLCDSELISEAMHSEVTSFVSVTGQLGETEFPGKHVSIKKILHTSFHSKKASARRNAAGRTLITNWGKWFQKDAKSLKRRPSWGTFKCFTANAL